MSQMQEKPNPSLFVQNIPGDMAKWFIRDFFSEIGQVSQIIMKSATSAIIHFEYWYSISRPRSRIYLRDILAGNPVKTYFNEAQYWTVGVYQKKGTSVAQSKYPTISKKNPTRDLGDSLCNTMNRLTLDVKPMIESIPSCITVKDVEGMTQMLSKHYGCKRWPFHVYLGQTMMVPFTVKNGGKICETFVPDSVNREGDSPDMNKDKNLSDHKINYGGGLFPIKKKRKMVRQQ